jgi:DNA primase small subunit
LGKTIALSGRTLEWARERFRTYYGAAVLEPPPQIARREFAAFPFTTESMMRRHAAFPDVDGFRGFLRRESPRHVYYSSAYYRFPDHPTMAQKEWLGADLIFDLDADHLRGATGLSYPDQLLLVRSRVRDLLDDFLFGDLGVDPSRTLLVFSGGRGYHVHVRDEAFARLTSPERREIVEYIQGTGVDPVSIVFEQRGASEATAVALTDRAEGEGEAEPRGGRRVPIRKQLPPADAPGWAGRIARSVDRRLIHWDEVGAATAERELRLLGIERPGALVRQLVTEGKGRSIRTHRSLSVLSDAAQRHFLDSVLKAATIEVQGETDAPVTTDIHRLIRLPGSLHGGTGFRVVPLDRATLDSFDPFVSARPFVGSGETELVLTEPVDYPFPGRVQGSPGDTGRWPDDLALFLVLRGDATLPPEPTP